MSRPSAARSRTRWSPRPSRTATWVLALPILAPSGVAVALTQWGTDSQQKTYLPAFAGENVPAAAVVVSEPRALFDPFALQPRPFAPPAATSSTASRASSPPRARPNCSSSPPNSTAVRRSSSSSPTPRGLSSRRIRAWVCAPPASAVWSLTDVAVPESAILGDGDADQRAREYADAVRLARLGWASLAVGTSQAVLDYVIPYANEREAFASRSATVRRWRS